jgi:hypothetical protein
MSCVVLTIRLEFGWCEMIQKNLLLCWKSCEYALHLPKSRSRVPGCWALSFPDSVYFKVEENALMAKLTFDEVYQRLRADMSLSSIAESGWLLSSI